MIDTYFKQYFWTFHLVVLAGSAFLVARTVNAYVGGALAPAAETIANTPREANHVDHAQDAQVPLKAFLDRNIFHAAREDLVAERLTKEREAKNGGAKSVFDENNCARSKMQAVLLATVVARDKEGSVAVFEDTAKKEQIAHRIGDSLLEQAPLVDIDWRRVTVNHDGRCEFFSLEEEDPTKPTTATPVAGAVPNAGAEAGEPIETELGKDVKKISANEFEIKKVEIDNVLSNLNTIATQARIVPNFTNGKADGFKLFSIRPGSLYSKIGIENGDVISRINGYEMNSPDKALEIYSKLKDATTITVDVVRNGSKQTLTYQIR